MKNCKSNTNEKNRDKDTVWLSLLLIIAIVIIILLICRGCARFASKGILPTEDQPVLVYDDSAKEGGWEEADLETIVQGLNEKVEAGMINISMNTTPVFASGTAEGNLMIVNESINNYPQIVEIVRNDTGDTIYKSGGIPVGSKVERAKLSVNLPAGTYECTAYFHNVDPETGADLGAAGAIIQIIVQS